MTVTLTILSAFQLPTALTSICAHNRLFFFDLKRVKDYILITSSEELMSNLNPRAQKAKRKENYPEKSWKNKAEQEPF